MRKIVGIIIVSILFLQLFGIGISGFPQIKGDTETVDAASMLIIGPEDFSSPIQRLMAHKESHGINTMFRSTKDIYQQYDGRDDAEKIKYFIKDSIEQNQISMVLLIGGRKGQSFQWHVPVRYVQLDDGSGSYTSYFTDLYFADIYDENQQFDDWDSNQNDVFGEWGPFSGDDLDLVPDVCLGRLPCRNSGQAEAVVEKIIAYEENTYGSSWFSNAVLVAGDTFPDVNGYEGEEVCDYVSEYLTDFSIKKLYATTGAIDSSDHLISAINNGCGIVFTRGKGGQDRLRVYTPENEEIIALHNTDITSLTNKDEYPIFILGECIHAKFDVTLLNFLHYLLGTPNILRNDCLFECIAERLVHAKDAGAIAVLSNVNLCYGTIGDQNGNDIIDDAEFFGGKLATDVLKIYKDEGKNTLGEIFKQTIVDYMDTYDVHRDKLHCKSIQDWILLGDPSLQIGGYPPAS